MLFRSFARRGPKVLPEVFHVGKVQFTQSTDHGQTMLPISHFEPPTFFGLQTRKVGNDLGIKVIDVLFQLLTGRRHIQTGGPGNGLMGGRLRLMTDLTGRRPLFLTARPTIDQLPIDKETVSTMLL